MTNDKIKVNLEISDDLVGLDYYMTGHVIDYMIIKFILLYLMWHLQFEYYKKKFTIFSKTIEVKTYLIFLHISFSLTKLTRIKRFKK